RTTLCKRYTSWLYAVTPAGMFSPTANSPQVTTVMTASTARATISSFVLFILDSPVIACSTPDTKRPETFVKGVSQRQLLVDRQKIADHLPPTMTGDQNSPVTHSLFLDLHPYPGRRPLRSRPAPHIVVLDTELVAIDHH